jgi:hypothetical protein
MSKFDGSKMLEYIWVLLKLKLMKKFVYKFFFFSPYEEMQNMWGISSTFSSFLVWIVVLIYVYIMYPRTIGIVQVGL